MVSSLVLVACLTVTPQDTPVLDFVTSPVRVAQRFSEVKPLRSFAVRVIRRRPLRTLAVRAIKPLSRKPVRRVLRVYRFTAFE